MSDLITIPVAALGPLAAIASAVFGGRKTRKLEQRLEKVEKSERDCLERLFREIELGASRAAIPIDPFNPPASLPPPDWDERTPLRTARAELEAKGLAAGIRAVLEEYLQKTPPRHPSRF